MQSVLRVLILSLFAFAGVGIAIAVVLHPELLPPLQVAEDTPPLLGMGPAAPAQIADKEIPGSLAPTYSLPPPANAASHELAGTGITPAAPMVAAIRPAVADEASLPVSELTQLLRETVESQGNALATAMKALVPAPAAASSPPAQREDDTHETQENFGEAAAPPAPLPPPLEPATAAQPRSSTPPADAVPAAAADTAGQLPPPGSGGTIRADDNDRLTINIRQADIREVLETLGQQGRLNILASPSVTGVVSATLTDVDAQRAVEVLVRNAGFALQRDGDFLFVATPAELEQMSRTDERVATRVYRPNYVTAAELQKLVAPLLSAGIGEATVTTNRLVTSTPPKVGIAAGSDQVGGDDFAGTDVLLIRDYESVLGYIDQLVAEIDQQPRQVALEAMILSVRLDDENELGVNFELLRDEGNARLISGIPLNDLAAINLSDGGLKFGFLNTNVAVFVKALETIGDTNVVASPRLMCLNKQRAEILIGSQLGYVSTTVTETASTQAVEFLEVGTQLRFRPFISDDGLIRLEVHPELSTGTVRIEQGFTLPDKDVTHVTTNIMCRDGATVIIGGLIREDLSTTTNQIPLLGSVPLAGALFRQKTENIQRREIIVLITPRIVREPEEYAEGEVAKFDFLERQANYADKMSPIGKRHYGMQYLRKARAAWNAGDVETALRYVNLAIHFDSQSREAAALHADILAVLPPGRDHVTNHLRQGLLPGQHPVREYSRRGVPWQANIRGRTASPPGAIVHGAETIHGADDVDMYLEGAESAEGHFIAPTVEVLDEQGESGYSIELVPEDEAP